MTEERDTEREKAATEDADPAPEDPNEGSPGHHPDEHDVPKEDTEADQSFPASDPPANY
jgi:hypothetical protein